MGLTKLHNGAEELSSLVWPVMFSLRGLFEDNPIAFYELVTLARNPSYRLFGNAGKVLSELGLVKGSQLTVHPSIRNIILSAAEGEGFEMKIRNPCVEATA